MNPALFDPPRWKNGPLICRALNLPAHETREAAWAFLESIAMAGRVVKLGKCPHCGWWHHKCKTPAPSGGSSGTERHA